MRSKGLIGEGTSASAQYGHAEPGRSLHSKHKHKWLEALPTFSKQQGQAASLRGNGRGSFAKSHIGQSWQMSHEHTWSSTSVPALPPQDGTCLVSTRPLVLQQGFFYPLKVTEISVLSAESRKIRYQPIFSGFSFSHTDRPNSPAPQFRTYNVLFLFLYANKCCLIA